MPRLLALRFQNLQHRLIIEVISADLHQHHALDTDPRRICVICRQRIRH